MAGYERAHRQWPAGHRIFDEKPGAMRTIFVATDFSNASHNALQYALGMAAPFRARVILFHAYTPQVISGADSAIVVPVEETMRIVKDRLVQHVCALPNAVPPIEQLQEEGPAAETILKVARAQQADIIISGMKRDGKKFRQIFGSTVTELANLTNIPMLVVPEEASYRPPQKIALASDIAPETAIHTLDALSEIGERFHSKVFIVRVISNRFEEVYELLHRPAKLNRLSRALETQYTYAQHKDVAEAINFFIQAEGIHLLALVPHKHTLLEKWFFKSTTKTLIFKSHVPLLILPEPKLSQDPSSVRG